MAKLNINGKARDVQVEADTPLLWVIREQLGLTGTKYGCGVAQCGACSVLVNGEVQRSCVIPVGSVKATDRIVTCDAKADSDKCIVAAVQAVPHTVSVSPNRYVPLHVAIKITRGHKVLVRDTKGLDGIAAIALVDVPGITRGPEDHEIGPSIQIRVDGAAEAHLRRSRDNKKQYQYCEKTRFATGG